MAVITTVITECFKRFNEISTTKVEFDSSLVSKCHAVHTNAENVCISKRTGKPLAIAGTTAKYIVATNTIEFCAHGIVVIKITNPTGIRNAVTGHFLHSVENLPITVVVFNQLLKLMTNIIDDVVADLYAQKLGITFTQLLEDIEFLHTNRVTLTKKLDDIEDKCTAIAKFAADYNY